VFQRHPLPSGSNGHKNSTDRATFHGHEVWALLPQASWPMETQDRRRSIRAGAAGPGTKRRRECIIKADVPAFHNYNL